MRQLAIATLICTGLLAACGKGERGGMDGLAASAVQEATAPKTEQLQSLVNSQVPAARQLVRQADAHFRVKDVYQSSLQIENIVAELGGFVTQNHIQSRGITEHEVPQANGKLLRLTEYDVDATIELRLPSEQTQALLRHIAPMVVFLDERNFKAHDVSIKLLEQQLALIRDQASANEVKQVEKASASDQLALAVAKNQLQANQDEANIQSKLIADRVAFSTITLNFYQDRQIQRSEHEDLKAQLAAAEPGFGSKLLTALHQGWQGFLETIIALTYLWPVWLVCLLFGLIWRYFRRNKTRPQHVEIPEETPVDV